MDERRLRKFFHFTEEDLLNNRRVQFSKEQIKRLQVEARKERKSAWESATILFVIAAAGLAVGLMIGLIAPSLPGRIFILLLMGILWPSVWAGRGVQIIRAAHRLQEPIFCQVSGLIHIARYEDEYTVQVGGMEFDVDENPAGVLNEGDEYIVYYVKATEEILSVDAINSKL
jgi:hypothetical protein